MDGCGSVARGWLRGVRLGGGAFWGGGSRRSAGGDWLYIGLLRFARGWVTCPGTEKNEEKSNDSHAKKLALAGGNFYAAQTPKYPGLNSPDELLCCIDPKDTNDKQHCVNPREIHR